MTLHAMDPTKPPKPKIVGNCVVCDRSVIEKLIKVEPIHDPHGVIGPGYRPLRPGYTTLDGYTCVHCGLVYAKPPPRLRDWGGGGGESK